MLDQFFDIAAVLQHLDQVAQIDQRVAPAAGGPTWYLPFTKEATPELHLADGWLMAVPPTEVGEREPD